MSSPETLPPRGLLSDIRLVAPALAVAAVLGYVVYVGVGRLLGPTDFVVFAGFWGLAFGAGGVLASLEQEGARLSSSVRASSVQHLLVPALALATALLLLGAAALPLIVGRILGGSPLLAALWALAVVGFAVQFAVRGSAVGVGDVGRYSWLIVVEAALRASALGVVVLTDRVGVATCATAVVLGSFAWLLVPGRTGAPAAPVGAWPDRRLTASRLTRLVLAASCTSAVVTGFPALAAAFTGRQERAELGVLLAALTLTRLPLLLLAPIQAVLVPAVVRRLATGGAAHARTFLAGIAAGIVLAGAALALLLTAVGPVVVTTVFGRAFVVRGAVLGGLTVGSALTGLLLVLAAGLVAMERHSTVTVAWATCLLGLVAALALPLPLVERIVLSLVAGPLLGVAVAATQLVLAGRASSDRP